MTKLYINGYFINPRFKNTGLYRYAINILLELDKIVRPDEIDLVVPNLELIDIKLCNIAFIEMRSKFEFINNKEMLWVNCILNKITHEYSLVNLCNFAPLLRKNQLVVVHDMIPFRYPKSCGYLWGMYYRFMLRMYVFNCNKIVTVSNFSAREIKSYFANINLPYVIPNSADGFLHILPDAYIIQKLDLYDRQYIMILNSQSQKSYKNLDIIEQLAKISPEKLFIVVGQGVSSINLKYTGYISDSELKSLYLNCEVFIMPSLYEGFGIPLLEAMICNTAIIAADIPVFHEIGQESIMYFNPHDAHDLKSKLEIMNIKNSAPQYGRILDKYSWHTSAIKLSQLIIDGDK